MHLIVTIVQNIVSIPFRLGLYFFGRFEVYGRENLRNLDQSKGIILASNHNSQIDSIVIVCALKLLSRFIPAYFVSLERKYYKRFPIGKYFYGGLMFDLAGGIPAKKGLRDYSKALSRHETALRQGKTISIYPEGRVYPGKEMGKAKGGVGYLAEATGATVVPVSINGNGGITAWQFFTFKRRITLTFGRPLTFELLSHEAGDDHHDDHYKRLSQYILNKVYVIHEQARR